MTRGIDAVFVRDIAPVGVRPHNAGRFVDYPLLPLWLAAWPRRFPACIAGMIANKFHRFIKMCVKHKPLSLFPPLPNRGPARDLTIRNRPSYNCHVRVVTPGLL